MPSSHKRKTAKRVSRSTRLRKYELVYEEYMRKYLTTQKKKSKHSTPVKKSHKTDSKRNSDSKKKQSIEIKKNTRKKLETESRKKPRRKETRRKETRRKETNKHNNLNKLNSKETNKPNKPNNLNKLNSKENKRPLNTYQKFVRYESKKSKYKGMEARERMSAISKEWRKKKGYNC
jgi:hypothetical protein